MDVQVFSAESSVTPLCWLQVIAAVYSRFPDGYFPRMVFFPRKTFRGWSFSRMIRFPERLREW